MRLQTTELNKSIKSKSKMKNQSKKIVESLSYKIKDISLAKLGRDKIDISEKEMPGLMELRKKYSKSKPLKGFRLTGSLHMTIETAILIETLKDLTLEINDYLVDLFLKADLILVDFKLEFGKNSGKIYLGDEFTPDGCRVWDKETKKKLDKDRFRLGLGDVVESYQEIAHRLGVDLT